jgi:predicted aspartyl protease
VEAEVTGPSAKTTLVLALDTGATGTLINARLLTGLRYDPAADPQPVRVATASGVELVPRVKLQKITALGQERTDFEVLCHTLPPSMTVDGLLGLDFLRGHILTIDFQAGLITLS